jgi:hypothetical protein
MSSAKSYHIHSNCTFYEVFEIIRLSGAISQSQMKVTYRETRIIWNTHEISNETYTIY